ncbi:MAG: hypothetical protein HYZ34_11365 [Ignavibacteriae bacterium]|nr:hypothetical protein [Ignavibacteriota bacterium]
MSTMFDIIGSVVALGIITLMITTMNIGLTKETYKTNNTMQLQFEAIQLARIIEFDIYKIGYRTGKQSIVNADSTNFKFKANLFDMEGITDVIEYKLTDPEIKVKVGPTYKRLIRKVNDDTLAINYNVLKLNFAYYTGRDSQLSVPVSGSWKDSIKSVKVYLTLESFDELDSTFIGAFYSKLIYPRNLQ